MLTGLLESTVELRETRGVLPPIRELELKPPRPRATCGTVLMRDHVDVLRAQRLDTLKLGRHLVDESSNELSARGRQVGNSGAALADVPVEQADPGDDVGELVELRSLVVGGQRGECLQAHPREDLHAVGEGAWAGVGVDAGGGGG